MRHFGDLRCKATPETLSWWAIPTLIPQMTTTPNYPFVSQTITDADGRVTQVVLNWLDYQRLLSVWEDEALYQAMLETEGDEELSLDAALEMLKSS